MLQIVDLMRTGSVENRFIAKEQRWEHFHSTGSQVFLCMVGVGATFSEEHDTGPIRVLLTSLKINFLINNNYIILTTSLSF